MNKANRQALFAKRLSFLARSGLTIPACLSILEAQSATKRERADLAHIRESVERGKALSESIAARRGFMSAFGTAVIAVGESSGTLSENLEHLSAELTKSAALRSKAAGALVYPALITIATIALTASLILFIFPKILPLFSGLDVPLPLSTRIVLFANAFLEHWGLALLLAFGAAIAGGALLFAKNGQARRMAERALFATPIGGGIARAYRLANVSRTLSLLLMSGMTLREALPKTAAATGSLLYRREIERLADAIEEGRDLAAFLKERRAFFPDMLAQMVGVGESSGTLAEALAYAAAYYEGELDEAMKRLSGLIEPVLMIVMGSLVGFVAVSMITPIYEITRYLHGA